MYPSHLSFTLHSTSTHTQPIPSPVSQHSNFYAGQPFSTPHGRATFKQFTSLIHEATRPLVHNPTDCIQNFSYKYLSIMEKYVSLHTLSPDGGIGRRAGLKHQWSNPSRFDPGSGYYKSLVNYWFARDFSFLVCTKSVLYNSVIRKVYFYSISSLSFIFN